MKSLSLKKKLQLALFSIIIIGFVYSCSKSGGGTYNNGGNNNGGGTQSGNSVSIKNFAFSPASLSVAAGTTVTWTNNDATTHTVTSDNGSFDSGDLLPGKTFSVTFKDAGAVSYHCKIHSSMKATVTAE